MRRIRIAAVLVAIPIIHAPAQATALFDGSPRASASPSRNADRGGYIRARA
jgi:hypothetical protein